MKSIIFIIPYFGHFNNYFEIWLNSCAHNPTIDWLIFTDCKNEYDYPRNVKVVYTTFDEIRTHFQSFYDFPISLEKPYKLCDFRPAYGEVFYDYIKDYDFWGYCDTDLVWGDLRKFFTEEILEINGKELFRRTENVIKFTFIKHFEKFLITDFVKNSKTATAIAQNSLNKTDLFLMNGFKTIVSSRLTDLIQDYFAEQFLTVYHADEVKTLPVLKEKIAGDVLLNEAVAAFGVKTNKLVYYKKEKNKEPPVLCSVVGSKKKQGIMPAELFESYGTVRFTYMYPLIVKAMRKGATIIIDEFDASIHPMAIMNIINIFHNDEINKNNAQLIFNTHNPLYLNNNLFRRDEIKFVDRDDETMNSKLYSLSDFGTKGTNARKGKDYMNNYFINEYGAIKDIDFTEVFRKIIEET